MAVKKKGRIRRNLDGYRQRVDDIHLENYRQVLDDLLKNLTKMREIKYNKINPILAVVGVFIVALGGVLMSYSVSVDIFTNHKLTFFGVAGIFVGMVTVFAGYIASHRGLTGYWV
jgi:Mg2+ and Co2+ transporter CorA